MQITSPLVSQPGSTIDELLRILTQYKRRVLLELGCGKAEITRRIATEFAELQVIAMEVDEIQHKSNLELDHPKNIEFQFGGAQEIARGDSSVDAILMVKSLHHVPLDVMDSCMREIARVLNDNGIAIFVEPIYAGVFNDILKIFHDEKTVREAAFTTLKNAVESRTFQLVEQLFFSEARTFQSYDDFKHRVINVTHTTFEIDEHKEQQIQSAYEKAADTDGKATMASPIRLDVLIKKAS